MSVSALHNVMLIKTFYFIEPIALLLNNIFTIESTQTNIDCIRPSQLKAQSNVWCALTIVEWGKTEVWGETQVHRYLRKKLLSQKKSFKMPNRLTINYYASLCLIPPCCPTLLYLTKCMGMQSTCFISIKNACHDVLWIKKNFAE